MRPLSTYQTALLFTCLLSVFLGACSGPQATAGMIQVEILADSNSHSLSIPSGSTVQQALDSADIQLDPLDRVDPPVYTLLTDGAVVTVTRVREYFEIEEIVIPFDRQTIRNEDLPEGETRLLQPGVNGLQEITYRILEEEGEEISRSPVKNVTLHEAEPEIIMIGLQAAYTPLPIDGRLVYVSGGNAWLIQGNTGNRRPLVLTGDLDGRIARLSPDGDWFLFTRHTDEDDEDINTLWAISTTDLDAEPRDLRAKNIIHFADWVPSSASLSVVYSSVEPSPAPPGWQAYNNLIKIPLSTSGRALREEPIIEANAGGQYGWWGTNFLWGSNSDYLAYARADSVGLVDLDEGLFIPLREFAPYQTLSDWAWVPGLAWGHDDRTLFYIDHGSPIGLESPGASPVFDLVALTGRGGVTLPLTTRAGMFAYPSVSPIIEMPNGEIYYHVAYFQAISPLESDDSNYRLMIMDRDGSNLRELFPPPGEPGLEPQQVRIAWSPGADRLGILYRGDLWIVDVANGIGQRVTSDGQMLNYDWKP
jgi:hypothetical protein